VIQTYELRKVAPASGSIKIPSLKSCSLTVYHETFGILGPNGAGKTTLLKLLGIVRPSSGQGLLLGQPLGDRAMKQRVGYLPENPISMTI